ncbi:MSEP-CTERM sorting domain-containing protein [Hymenobacter amundsenii]|uniref:MSEP-CTERM sorting domain-containing protein n=1 Tax=Hymenobacter amundsenii TaxID=2006685 RepID=A0A246FKA6_9BACT|nr:MSEP-CTERM sorting domain-containing protein [Hymenobacter amundsenii]OWP62978.1 MSEP-CTERM sorting domain-containing protein [Hymenobacter amundsenii]
MRTLLNPKWLWLLNTLPVGVLLAWFGAEYVVIGSLLEPAGRLTWHVLGAVLLGLGVVHAAYAGWLAARQQELPISYALAALGTYIGLLYAYGTQVEQLFPAVVPRWMLPNDLPLYAGTFLMPTLAHAVAVLVLRLTPENRVHKVLPNFGAALAVPVAFYLFVQLVLPLRRFNPGPVATHALVVLLIAGTLLFLLALSRGVYLLAQQRAAGLAPYRWLGVLVVAGVLPLVGLAVNNGDWGVLGNSGFSQGGVFGDFSGPWWYGLAAFNAVLLLCPNPANPWARGALFLGRGVLLSYTLYFFLVFLPFLPLSVVLVAALGAGFLLLAPLVLFIVHVRVLSHDYAALRPHFGRRGLLAALLVAGAVLPLAVAGQYAWHRATLHRALDYVYTPTYGKPADINPAALARVLRTVSHHKGRRGSSITGAQLPYLSSFYNWLVLDNLTLPDTKISLLSRVFATPAPANQARQQTENQASQEPPAAGGATPQPAGPHLTRLAARSHYDARQRAWVSWLDLTVANDSIFGSTEYSTRLELPAGCFVRNYYLDMAGRREFGILAEKRAAAWVYRQIRNENRDPGLLRYLSGNTLELRVFPFAAGEVRRTGLQLLHPEPLTLQLDGQSVTLGANPAGPAPKPAGPAPASGDATYVSAARKAALPALHRQPYVHFLVDMSGARQGSWPRYRQQMAALLGRNRYGSLPEYTLTGSSVRQLTEQGFKQLEPAQLRFEGGFYLDRALRQVLVQATGQATPRYPVLVVVTDDFKRAILPANFADLRHAFPDSDFFYELLPDGRLVAHSLQTNPAMPLDTLAHPVPAGLVVAWPSLRNPVAYLPANGQPDIVLTGPVNAATVAAPPTAPATGDWQAGLALQAQWRAQLHHPEASAAAGRQLVETSFHTGILTPLTAYLALENDAQKAALRRKQAQLLAGHAALEADEDQQRMSEPADWLILALLAMVLLGRGWWQRRRLAVAG